MTTFFSDQKKYLAVSIPNGYVYLLEIKMVAITQMNIWVSTTLWMYLKSFMVLSQKKCDHMYDLKKHYLSNKKEIINLLFS